LFIKEKKKKRKRKTKKRDMQRGKKTQSMRFKFPVWFDGLQRRQK